MRFSIRILCFATALAPSALLHADPLLTSWVTEYSGKYARVYQTDADKTAGTTYTTWPSAAYSSTVHVGQSTPTYCGVHEIDESTSWVYVKTTGLSCNVMGPWYLSSTHVQMFPNMPKNQAITFRFPRVPQPATSKTSTSLGAIGIFVDGVSMFDGRDAFSVSSYTNGTTVSEANPGLGIWNRSAYLNEGATFDPAYAHQPGSGQYHYHAEPIALRYLLGDNILYNSSTKTYSENTANTSLKHSPILGWAADGYPVYGPYGYSSALDATSTITRMRTGYVYRNGQNGTTNLASTGRTTLPAWAQRAQNRTTLTTSQYGPNVTTSYPLGRYLEDYDYLGDHGKVLGTDFDMNEFNCRYCVTPEYPGGTYAYFTCIDSTGAPTFPYNIGRQFYGVASGGALSSITETVTTIFKGGPSAALTAQSPSVNTTTGDVTLTWSSVEGSTYQVQTSADLSTWASSSVQASPGVTTQVVDPTAAKSYTKRFYRFSLTSLATYDSTGF